MDIFEILLPPLYFVLIFTIALRYSSKRKKKDPVYEYFVPGLLIKMFGGVALGLTYFFYYKGGDTLNYYYTACSFVDLLLERPDDFMYLYFGNPQFSDYSLLNSKYEFTYWINDAYAFFVCKCFTPILLICFKSYFTAAIVVATICYLGVWRLFLVFISEFPHLKKLFVWSIIYVPSVIFWGSGLMKDSITFSSACIYVHGFYWFFTQKRFKIKYAVALVVAAYLLISIKPYILFALLPGSILWFLSLRMARVKSVLLKIIFAPALVVLCITIGLYSLQQLGDSLGKYSMDKVIKTASGAQQDLKQAYYAGNSFDIGDYEPTPAGMLSVSHKAIFATLFRPTFIDVQNIVMALCAIENTFILGFSIYLLFKLKVYRFFLYITDSPLLLFSFIFSLFFAFSVGVSISNFGALVRLKIPCIPFFLSSLVILNDQLNQASLKNYKLSKKFDREE
ncbi:MAG: hypothetical protein WCR21_04570 [Bacteroidota bacterium]